MKNRKAQSCDVYRILLCLCNRQSQGTPQICQPHIVSYYHSILSVHHLLTFFYALFPTIHHNSLILLMTPLLMTLLVDLCHNLQYSHGQELSPLASPVFSTLWQTLYMYALKRNVISTHVLSLVKERRKVNGPEGAKYFFHCTCTMKLCRDGGINNSRLCYLLK